MTQRGADRTWSVPEMVDRLSRALVEVIQNGEALVPCLRGPAVGTPDRADYNRAVGTYMAFFRQHSHTHERAAALADYLGLMKAPTDGVEYTGSADYRKHCAEEYRFAREIYDGQRADVRDVLHLGADDPEVLCMALPPTDAVTTSSFCDRIVVGMDAEGYHVGLLPSEADGAVVWSPALTRREEAVAAALRLHRASPVEAVAMEIEMVADAEANALPVAAHP